nr:MAG: hypothetical protein [Microvirus sp.]
MTVAALFVRRDSPYKSLPGVECYDFERDARTYAGPWPVVAHPPCRAWGRLRHMAKPRVGERELALFALDAVRRWGGVLEHPEASGLWAEAGLLAPLTYDLWGGFTVVVDQAAWGHRARKRTWLYVCRCEPPPIPPARVAVTTVERLCRAERERTPPELASWLVQCASSARPSNL